jgi:flagellar hook-associated protein 2
MTVETYTAITTSGQINFSGLGNGTDFNQLITKLVEVEQTRITKLQTWRQSWTDKQAALEELNTALLSLKSALASIDTLSEFLVKTSSVTNSSVMSVTTGSGADNGTHTVNVEQLAQAKSMVTATGYSSADTDINSSNADVAFSYVYQGTTYSVDVGADCTLSELADIINDDPNNAGVTASVVYDGSKYYLQMRGGDTGADATLTIASNSGLSSFSSADFETVTSNCDALLQVDGWPTNSYISRSSNTISDVIDGLTLSLKTEGEVTITTATDTDAVKANIQAFVEDMNTVRTLIQELTAVDTSSETASVLTGNYGVQLVDSRLKDVIASIGVGFDYTDDTYSVLSQLGISTDTDDGSTTEGLLIIDDDTLDEILASNADAVAKLFSSEYDASTSTSAFALSSYVDGLTECGTYDVSYSTDASGNVTSASINGHTAMISVASNGTTTLTGAYGYDEQGIVIKCIDKTANSTITGTVSLKQGKVGELIDVLDDLTDSNDGVLNIIDDNYDDIVDMIDDKIVFEQTRIANYESRLRTRFAKVDSMLSTLSDQQSAVTSMIDQLSSD